MRHDFLIGGRLFLITAGLSLFGLAPQVPGASYHFDLTDVVGSNFATPFPEAIVDLGVAFSHINSASIELNGVFSPGVVTPVTFPEHLGPLLPNDTVNLILRLGEVGTAWYEKDVYAIQDLQGYSGPVSFLLSLQGAEPTTVPELFPSGDISPGFDFLLDGRFGLAAGATHWLLSIYQVVEPPHFTLTGLVLHLEGIAVPEPASNVGAFCLLLGGVLVRQRQRG